MTRETIDFGIDLGTTNSTIAVLRDAGVEIIKNNEGAEYTPSAVWIDRQGSLHVGRRARQRLVSDPENAFGEFKLLMGTSTECHFKRSDRRMKPEELSAEILKSLRADVQQRSGEEVAAAVITVPAAFELPQCAATERAAQMAGLTLCPLLQEPVAAAMAYGAKAYDHKAFWLVYDLGGGTFDAAVIRIGEDKIEVVNHEGDNQLGGKLVDWAIVDELLIPALTRRHPLTEFRRGNPKWVAAIAKLKGAAEQAKIELSRSPSAEIFIDFLCHDDRGDSVEFVHELKRSEVEKLAAPLILRSLNLCKKVIAEAKLGVGDIEKVLLVGGPTLMPYVRERLAAGKEGLGIALDFSMDPLTVVARGAAVYAGTRLWRDKPPVAVPGQYALQLEYKPTGPDLEPDVVGKVMASDGERLSRFTIEFINPDARSPWRSGKIRLNADGAFMATLFAEKDRRNTYHIELCDAQGKRHPTVPDRLSYRVEKDVGDPRLTNSVGVAMADNRLDRLLEKGTPLPAQERTVHRTVKEVRMGQNGDLIHIPIMEGEVVRRADRNKLIGYVEIHADKVKRDVPAGSEVEIIVEVDESRLVRARAYVPILNEEFEEVMRLGLEIAGPKELAADFDWQKKRLADAQQDATKARDPRANEILRRIGEERMEHDVETALAAAETDPDAANKCQDRLRDLRRAVDDVEDTLEESLLLLKAQSGIKAVRQIVDNFGDGRDKQDAAALERETREAMETKDHDLLSQKVKEMEGLWYRVARPHIPFWEGVVEDRGSRLSEVSDRERGERLIAAAQRALTKRDVDAIEQAMAEFDSLRQPRRPGEREGIGHTQLDGGW